jgi:uncharacterized membrane protein YgcG
VPTCFHKALLSLAYWGRVRASLSCKRVVPEVGGSSGSMSTQRGDGGNSFSQGGGGSGGIKSGVPGGDG